MNDRLILVINPGSSSVKFAVYRLEDFDVEFMCSGIINGTTGARPDFTVQYSDWDKLQRIELKKNSGPFTNNDFYPEIEDWLNSHYLAGAIVAIAYRVVHGGDLYGEPVLLDNNVLQALTSLSPFAPLHQPICLQAVRYFMNDFPDLQHWACFDTAFHRTMPKVSQTFALPKHIREKGVKPYGFHGLSYQSVVNQLSDLLVDGIPPRLLVAHLGSGSSCCAILNGKSIATTMTFSPLDGLPMATRCGRLDPAAVLYMINYIKIPSEEIARILNKESGLAGLSGLSGDFRELIKSRTDDAQFALEYFINGIVRSIGEMTAILGGLDALVFTGGIGANSPLLRHEVCSRFQWLGLSIDEEANNHSQVKINDSESCIDIFSLKTNEERVMANWVSTLMREQ